MSTEVSEYLIQPAPGGRALPSDSRIYSLARTEDRKFARWGAMPAAVERRIILSLAEGVLPDPYPPSREEIAFAAAVKRLLIPASHWPPQERKVS